MGFLEFVIVHIGLICLALVLTLATTYVPGIVRGPISAFITFLVWLIGLYYLIYSGILVGVIY